jgi:hypothetical protein
MHVIEKREVYVIDGDLCLQFPGKSLGNLAADPVLSERSLNENVQRQDEEQQGKEKPFQYFLEALQGQ